MVKRGARKAYGLDLSPKMIDEAKKLAQELRLEEKVSFEIGDGAKGRLPQSDIVVLDKVICCYPDMNNLLSNSITACREYTLFQSRRIEACGSTC